MNVDFRSFELSITSVHRGPHGGSVVIGRDCEGALRRATIDPNVAPRDPAVGEQWRVTGVETDHPRYGVQVAATIALPLLPSGEALVRYLATNQRFPGIGRATAKKLWDALGDDIYQHILAKHVDPIARVIGTERAAAIVDGFGFLADEIVLFRWLDRYGVSPRVAGAASSIWGLGAIDIIKADPYALTLLEPWTEVDLRALRMGSPIDGDSRLFAAVDESLAIRFRHGDTAAARNVLIPLIAEFAAPWNGDCDGLITQALERGRITQTRTGLIQSRACRFMESEIERSIVESISRSIEPIEASAIDNAIHEVEAEIGTKLSSQQRNAVFVAMSHSISVVTGGAGTGKTTVIRAILRASEARCAAFPVHEQAQYEQIQLALAGRAVKRIVEATGKEAMTIARFLRRLSIGGRRAERGLIILDEASMLDTPSLYRIISEISSDIDIVFVGDPAQLPPIGAGMPFDALLASSAVPKVELDVIHRQRAQTGIPLVSVAVRAGRAPRLAPFEFSSPLASGVFIVEANADDVASETLRAFRSMCGTAPKLGHIERLHSLDVQVLCPTKGGAAGASAINQAIEAEYMVHQPAIPGWGLSVGSKILWLSNDYRKAPMRDKCGRIVLDERTSEPTYLGFMNGAIGIIKAAREDGAWVELDDGTSDDIHEADLKNLTHGWAITVHKAQGSAFRRVIVPIVKSSLLDRTLIYTAITRATDSVVIVGDPKVLARAIEAPPRALRRTSGLAISPSSDAVSADEAGAELGRSRSALQ